MKKNFFVSSIKKGLFKGALLAINLLGNGLFFAATYQYPLDWISYYQKILVENNAVKNIPDLFYIAFLIWAAVWLIAASFFDIYNSTPKEE